MKIKYDMSKPIVVTGLTIVFITGLGLGLILGIDSQEAKVKKLEADKKVLIKTLVEGAIVNGILEARLENLNKLLRKLMEEQEKERLYNEGALE